MSDTKPRVIILGGCGFIGRNFVKYLTDNNLASAIRVADKMTPLISFMSPEFLAIFKTIEFIQADLNNQKFVDKVFAEVDGKKWDYVFNLASETRLGLEPAVYKQKCKELAVNVAKHAAKVGIKHFIEVSTAHVYKPQSKKAAKEGDEIEPWTMVSLYKSGAEEVLLEMKELPLTILRPAVVYGEGDVWGIMPRCVCAITYKHEKEKMKFLWDGETRLNTVHVYDVVAAMWHAANLKPESQIYNLADKSDTDQGKINKFLGIIFGIETGFLGTIISNFAKLNMTRTVEEVNQKHLIPWTELKRIHNINNTPLSPYLDKELLYHKHLFIDGSKIESTGFKYAYPEFTLKELESCINKYIELKLFPPINKVGEGGESKA